MSWHRAGPDQAYDLGCEAASNVEGSERCFARQVRVDAFTSLSVQKALDDVASLASGRWAQAGEQ